MSDLTHPYRGAFRWAARLGCIAGLLTGCTNEGGSAACDAPRGCDESEEGASDKMDAEGSDESDATKRSGADGGASAGRTASDRGEAGGANRSSTRSGEEAGPKPSAAGSGVPCAVQEVLRARCALCHGAEPSFGAPLALASASDFRAENEQGRKLFELARERVNEVDPRERMPPDTSPQLEAEQLATLDAWFEAGAPVSDEVCARVPADDARGDDVPASWSTDDLECHRFTAHSGDFKAPYKVGTALDAYVNFTFTAPWQDTGGYAVAIRPIIDNDEVIHHWLLFQDNVAGAARPPAPSLGAHPGAELIRGWAPGGEPLDLRGAGVDVGMELAANSTYTLETHYNSSDPDALDASGVEICLARHKPANVAAISWLGYDQLAVPATKWTGTCVPAVQQQAHILAVSPHMHQQGTHMKATIHRADGTDEILHDEPFDFNHQRHYDKDVTIHPGDTITTECTFAQPMSWGEGTGQEMCLLFTYAYPKGVLVDFGPWGRLAHGENACLGQ